MIDSYKLKYFKRHDSVSNNEQIQQNTFPYLYMHLIKIYIPLVVVDSRTL